MKTIFQDILSNERHDFLKHNHLDDHQFKAFNYMAACGSETFGFNSYECEECGHKFIHYNSCGNRHCPSCQASSREEWISNYKTFLLDIPYFHIVFTVPDSLNDIFLSNKEAMYNLLFKTSSQSLLAACEEKYGQIGFTSILHTWGQTLWFHPHIHMIVSSGGISYDENNVPSFNRSPDNFLVSVIALSKLFRGKFISAMKKLSLVDSNNHPIDFQVEPYLSLISELYSKDWVVHSKKPFGSNNAVLNYIGRYSHRVAISNSRITGYNEIDHSVSFTYKDYRDNSAKKEMTLHALEFIRRFMLHILPPHFMKIRHYGFISNSNRKSKITLCRSLLNQSPPSIDSDGGADIHKAICQCPKCHGHAILISRRIIKKPNFHNNTS